ncbi:MAG: glutaredoxin domain-containing protein [Ilumatobacteraceae bacterium]
MAEIVMYQRPGCGFCTMLRRNLQRAEIPYREVDIWDEPEAAAFVRSVANGCETVPTIAIGTVAMVNPSLDEVIAAARQQAPDSVAHLDV